MLLGAALFFQRGGLFLQFMQPAFGQRVGLVSGSALAAQVGQAVQVGGGQGFAFRHQPLPPGAQAAALLFDVAAVGGQHLDLLLHLVDQRALRVGMGLGGAHRVFGVWQAHGLFFGLGGQHLGMFFGGCDLFGNRLQLGLGAVTPLLPLRGLGLQISQALHGALPPLHHVADAFFQPADL